MEKIREVVVEKMMNILEELPNSFADDHQDLAKLGLDSMMLMQLLVDLELHYSITFSDHELLYQSHSTIAKITENISMKLSRSTLPG